jgi:biopolymer transport protein ExbD
MENKEFDYINVIPLVDVMLVLLTIVLTTSTFIAAGQIPISLPKASLRRLPSPEGPDHLHRSERCALF